MPTTRTIQDLRPLLDASPVAMMLTDLETGRVLALNRRCEEEYRYRSEDMLGRTSLELGLWAEPSDRSRFLELLKANPDLAEMDALVRAGDGSMRLVRLAARVHVPAEGGACILLTSQDLEPIRELESIQSDLLDRQFLLESVATDVVARIAPDGTRRYTSPAIQNLLGWTPEELEGTSPFQHFHPDDVPMLKEVFGRLLNSGQPETPTYRSLRKDGTYVWVETVCSPVRDPSTGAILEIRTSTRDVTKRRAAEEDLRRSEELHRNLFASLSEGIILLDEQGVVFQANERAHAILNVPQGVLLGVCLTGDSWNFLGPDGEPLAPADLPGTKTLRDGQTRRDVIVGVHTPCGLVWISQNSSILSWASEGSRFILLVSFTDVTRRVESERALRESEGRLRLLADMSRDMISRHDLDARYLWASPSSRDILGLESDIVVGCSAMDFVHPDDLDLLQSQLARIFETETTRTRFRIVQRTGATIWVETIAVVVRDPATGAPLEIHCATRDIGERKRQEDLLETTQRIAHLGGWEHDLATNTVNWTPELYRIHEMDPEESGVIELSRTMDRLDEESLEAVKVAHERLVAERLPWNLVLRGTTAKGNPLTIRSSCEGVFENGVLVGLHGTVQDITELERVRAEFESASRMNKAILDTSEALIVVLDREGRVVRFNHACETASGWIEAELLGRKFFDVLIPAEEMDRVRTVFSTLKAGDFPSHHENHWLARDGKRLWTAWANSAILDHAGEVRYIVGIGINMSAHRAMQLELQASEARLRCLIDTAPEAVVILDVETGMFTDLNPAAETLFGGTRAELLRLGPAQVSPPVQPGGIPSEISAQAYITQALRGDAPSFEWTHRRLDGTDVLCEVHLARLPSDTNVLVRGSISDISDRRKTESVLQTLVRGTSSVFGQAFFEVLVKDLAQLLGVGYAFIGRVDDKERQVRTVALYTPGGPADNIRYDLEGTPSADVQGKCLLTIPSEVCRRYPSDRLLVDMRAESYMGVPLFSSSGSPIGLLAVIDTRPMTDSELARNILTIFAARAQGELERLEAESALRDLNLELEQRVQTRTAELQSTNRELEAFSYSVSHDLRSPLRAIDGYAQAIQEDYASAFDETGRHYLERIRASSHRMADLIDDLLSLSRSSRVEVVKSRVDLSLLAADILGGLARSNPDRRVEVRLDPGLQALADPVLIRSVLENLLDNAWKYTRMQPNPRIEFRSVPAPDGFQGFAVVDNGAGFDMAHAPKLFGTFQRLHKDEEFEGNGIGLATVRRIVERHGGSIFAEGELGTGATFRFQLPSPIRSGDPGARNSSHNQRE